jgi:hypothetical protein
MHRNTYSHLSCAVLCLLPHQGRPSSFLRGAATPAFLRLLGKSTRKNRRMREKGMVLGPVEERRGRGIDPLGHHRPPAVSTRHHRRPRSRCTATVLGFAGPVATRFGPERDCGGGVSSSGRRRPKTRRRLSHGRSRAVAGAWGGGGERGEAATGENRGSIAWFISLPTYFSSPAIPAYRDVDSPRGLASTSHLLVLNAQHWMVRIFF